MVMTDPWAFEADLNDGNPNQDNTPKGLRTWAESVQKNNDELKRQLADVLAKQKAYELSSVFEDLGISKSAARLYKGDADPEAIKSWVTDVKTAFGVGNTNELTETVDVPPVAPTLTAGQENLFKQLTNAGNDGRPTSGIEDVQRGINNAQSIQEMIAEFQNLR